jgi:hypothetical protein
VCLWYCTYWYLILEVKYTVSDARDNTFFKSFSKRNYLFAERKESSALSRMTPCLADM